MKKKLYLFIGAIFLLTGCSSEYGMPFSTSSYERSYDVYESSYSENQLVSYDAYLSMETKQYQEDSKSIVDEIIANGGVIISQNSDYATNDYTDFVGSELQLEAQIPKETFEALLEVLKNDYQISSFNLFSRDITNDIASINDELAVLKERLAQVNEDLAKEGLTFSQEQRLKQEQQSLEDQISDYEKQLVEQEHSVEYRYLNLRLSEVDYYRSEGYPTWIPFVRAFKNIFEYIAYGLVAGIVVALAIIPFLFVASLTYLLVRRFQYIMFEKLKRKIEMKSNKEKF